MPEATRHVAYVQVPLRNIQEDDSSQRGKRKEKKATWKGEVLPSLKALQINNLQMRLD
jgi:hypothetical protein